MTAEQEILVARAGTQREEAPALVAAGLGWFRRRELGWRRRPLWKGEGFRLFGAKWGGKRGHDLL